MEEMFFGGRDMQQKEKYSLRLKTDIPLKVNIIYIDKEYPVDSRNRRVAESDIDSIPMKSFWDGILREGWPLPPSPSDVKGILGVLATTMTRGGDDEFAENSFAILGKEYMILSLRMGYHFSTIEAMVTPDVSKNYIRLQFKEGGATIERRKRRIRLIVDILSRVGFENYTKGDFLDARLSYDSAESINRKLYLLGRITVLTKQLDMALSNDSIADWYTQDILKKLGLKGKENES
jgi:pyruvate,water dikinase